MKRNLFIILLLSGIITFTYRGLWNTFFQQDEWASLGFVLGNGLLGNISSFSALELLTGKERILGSLLNNGIHLLFPFQIAAFSVFALALHWLNSVLVYLLITRLTKSRVTALAGAVYFSVASVSSQAVSWISANTTTLPNAFFVLLSLHSILSYSVRGEKRNVWLSFLFAYIAALFKESSLFLFLVLPIVYSLYSKRTLRSVIGEFAPLFGCVAALGAFRLWTLLGAEGQGGVFVTRGDNSFVRLAWHGLLYPLVGLSQLYIPRQILFPISEALGKSMYTFVSGHPYGQAVVLVLIGDLVSILASFCITLITLAALTVKKLRPTILFGMAFLVLSFLPFVVVDRPASTFLESRYYYLGEIGAAVVLAAFLEWTVVWYRSGKSFLRIFGLGIVWVGVSLFLIKNAVYIHRDIVSDSILGRERISFLRQLDTLVPNLPERPILYVTGDSPGYYGIPNLAVPFQQGVGYTMMVWLYKSGRIPKELMRSMYLWNISEQGYREAGSMAFGYFWDRRALLETLRTNPKIIPSQIVALQYISAEHTLVDVTDQFIDSLQEGHE